MSPTESSHFISAPARKPLIATGAATGTALAIDASEKEVCREAWQRVIDYKLIEWGRDPAHLEEDDLIPPTKTAIACAIEIAKMLQREGLPTPMRVVPDGDGGVVIERWSGSLTESIEIDRQGRAEWVICRDGVVTKRIAWPAE